MEKKGTLLGATMLVAGTCIGGGMLALPLVTCQAGFLPSTFMMLLSWGFMTLTALYLAEVSLWMKEGSHVISMASRFLGPIGKAATWILFLFMGYASLVAYTAGGSELMQKAYFYLFNKELSLYLAAPYFLLLFGFIIYLGNIIVGKVNTILMIGLFVSYMLMIGSGWGEIDGKNLALMQFFKAFPALPLLLTIFSFQTIIPSLTFYLHKDGTLLRRSIILGTTVSFLVYFIWEVFVLGIVPSTGLQACFFKGHLATVALQNAIDNKALYLFADFFAFFAIITSFLGVGLGLFDFLADGLKIKRTTWGKIKLGLLIALPTLFFTLTIEKVFLYALDISGGLGDTLLNGIIPCLMVWMGRYVHKLKSDYRVFGGVSLIALAIGYALLVLSTELVQKMRAF